MYVNPTYLYNKFVYVTSDAFITEDCLSQGDALLQKCLISRIRHYEGTREPGETGTEWDTPASGLCRLY
jgi:hypothetical protein